MFEQPTVPAPRPTIGSTIRSSFQDAPAVVMTQRIPYIIILALAFLASLALLSNPQPIVGVQAFFSVCAVCVFFALPAALRTFIPQFRLTFGGVILLIVVGIGLAIAFEIGLFLLIVPGILVFVRWQFAPLLAVIGDQGNPYARSWNITRGAFWPTFGLIVAVSCIAGLIVVIPTIIVGLVAEMLRPSAPVLGLIVGAAYIFAVNFQYLALVRWMTALRDQPMAVSTATFSQTAYP